MFGLDDVGFPQVKGRMFEDMIQGLGGQANAANTGVDLAKGLARVRNVQGSKFIQDNFSGVSEDIIDSPIEIQQQMKEIEQALI